MHAGKNIGFRRMIQTAALMFLGSFVMGISPSIVSADGYLNDVQTTRHLGGVGNYLFHDVNDEAVVEEMVEVTSGKVDFVSISNSAPMWVTPSEMKSHTLYFKTGSFLLSGDAGKTLEEIAEVLRENPGSKVEVAGYADVEEEMPGKKRTKLSPEELSSARAKSVTKALHKRGILLSRIFWMGQGTVSNHSTAENRRVEVRIQ